MKKFLYDENALEIFRHLLKHTPQRIFFSEFYRTVFDYGDSYIQAILEEPEAASQNKNDLTRRVEFTKIDNRFKPEKYEEIMYEGVWISRIWIVRTLLYFTDHIIFETPEQAISGLPNETETDRAILQIASKATGAHEQIICHPESEEVAQVNTDFANLIDAGVILELDGKILGCFSYFNSFSFRGEIESSNELKEVAEFYEFIEVFS